MSRQLVVIGGASQSRQVFSVSKEEETETLMSFLQKQNLPIASSCQGLGHCQKCLVNETLISCQITVKDFLSSSNEVLVSYL